MQTYFYKAYNNAGTYQTGKVKATNTEQAKSKLLSKGLKISSLEPMGVDTSKTKKRAISRNEGDRICLAFLVKFHQLIDSGMPIGEACKMLSKRVKDPKMRDISMAIWKRLSDGDTFSKALGEFPDIFTDTVLHMIEAGEKTGNIKPILVNIIQMIEARMAIKKKVVSGLSYPCFVSFVAFGVVLFFLFYLLPKIESMLTSMGGEMSWAAAAILWIAEMAFMYGPVALILSLVAAIGISQWRQKDEGRYQTDMWLLKIPVLKHIVMTAEQSRISNLAQTLLGSGVNTTESLKLIEKSVNNRALQEKFKSARLSINDGSSFSNAFYENGILEDMDSDVLAISENTGNIVNGFTSLYKTKYQQIEANMKTLTLVITTTALAFAFSLVVLLTFGIATSILQLSTSIVGS